MIDKKKLFDILKERLTILLNLFRLRWKTVYLDSRRDMWKCRPHFAAVVNFHHNFIVFHSKDDGKTCDPGSLWMV